MIYLEKAFKLSFSFASRHSRESFKNSSISNNQFVSSKLSLSKKFSSLISSSNLTDQILLVRDQHTREQFKSFSLTSASLTSLSSDIFTRNSETIISTESLNMSEFLTQDFAESSEQHQSSFFTNQRSFETTFDSMFFAAQRTKIADIVAVVVRFIQMQQSISFSTTESQSINSSSAEYFKKWTTDEIDFFDSDVEEDDSVVNVDQHVFYKDIYAFVNRLKNMITIREDDKLRTILSQCFRGAALIWHFIELSDMKKDLLRQVNLSSWHQTLINRFKERTSVALSFLQNNRYTLTDARSGKDSRVFAQNIFRSVKATNMNSVHNQLTIAWNNLDWRFRANILESTIITSIRKFLNQLDFMTDIWHEMIKSQNVNLSKSFRDRFQNSRRAQNNFFWLNFSFSYEYDAYSNNQSFYQVDFRQLDRLEYQSRRFIPQSSNPRFFKKKSFASVLSLSRQSLQIINESNLNASDSTFFETKIKDQYKRDYKGKEKAYVIEKDEHENEMNSSQDQDEKYYHESNLDLNYYNPQKQDQDEKSEANFFTQIRFFTCRNCRAVLFFNNQLHKHLRRNICENFRRNIKHTALENEFFVNLATNISIIESSIDSSKDIGIEFEFRDWTYVKAMISLFIKDNEEQMCLDTSCSVILTNREFIKRHEAHYIIRRMTTSLNVRELRTNKHETWKYIIASIYFLEKITQEKFTREVIRREVHLMNDLKVNMLIDNDILESEDIFIDDSKSKTIIVSCNNMIISIEIRTLIKEMINKVLHVRFVMIISSRSIATISIHRFELSSSRDFLFESANLDVFMYAHIIDTSTNAIIAKNESDRLVKIPRNTRLEIVTKI